MEWAGNRLLEEASCSGWTRRGKQLNISRWYENTQTYNARISDNITSKELHVDACSRSLADGSRWNLERVGPIVSSGGYDWWQLAWQDALRDGSTYESMVAHWVGAIDAVGSPVLLPPVHLHHVHLNPCAKGVYCPNGGFRVVVHHGDWQFANGSVESFGQDYGRMQKQLPPSMSADAEVNDVRPRHSAPMHWMLLIGARLLIRDPTTFRTNVSVHRLHGPGVSCDIQVCDVHPFPVPSHEDSFTLFAARMPTGGRFVEAAFHAHMSAFHTGVLLDVPFLRVQAYIGTHSSPSTTHHTQNLGFDSNVELREKLLMKFADRVVCRTEHASEVVGGIPYDRAAVLSCNAHWDFREGLLLTGVSLNGPVAGWVIREMSVMEHSIWYFSYLANDNESRYTQSFGQEPPSTDVITEGCTTVRAASAFLVFVLIRVMIYCERVVF